MSVRKNESEALRSWWDGVRLDMLSEYHLDSVSAPGRGVDVSLGPWGSGTRKGELRFEMLCDVPALTVRRDDGVLLGVVGDDMGSADPVAKALFSDPATRLPASVELEVLSRAREGWVAVGVEYAARVAELSGETCSLPAVYRRLASDLILDDPSGKAEFYRLTRAMDRNETDNLKRVYLARMEDVYKERFERGFADRTVVERDLAFARRDADVRFSAWYALEGRLNWRLSGLATCRERLGPEEVAAVADWALRTPAYAPYVESGIKPWVAEVWRDAGLGMATLPERFRKAPARKAARKAGTARLP